MTIGAVLMIALGGASYDLSSPASWALVVGAFAVTTLKFCALGVALASVLPTAE